MADDRVIRFAGDLVESATVEGARTSRSAKQQLDHWARVGRQVSAHHSAAQQRVERVLAGQQDMASLGVEERLVANAEIDAAIAETTRALDFGSSLSEEGLTAVALDEQGRIVRYLPGGGELLID